jgi:K+ transporter
MIAALIETGIDPSRLALLFLAVTLVAFLYSCVGHAGWAARSALIWIAAVFPCALLFT